MEDINWQEAIDRYFKGQQQVKPPLEDSEFYCSSLNGCVRQTVMNRLRLKELDAQTLRHFGLGTLLHNFLEKEVSQGYIGKPVEFEKRIELEVDSIKFRGRVDCFDGETVYDFKSSAAADVSAKYDNWGYNAQVSIYCAALGVEKGKLIYVDKRSLAIVEKDVKLISLEEIVEFCNKVKLGLLEYREEGELPARDNCWQCKKEVE